MNTEAPPVDIQISEEPSILSISVLGALIKLLRDDRTLTMVRNSCSGATTMAITYPTGEREEVTFEHLRINETDLFRGELRCLLELLSRDRK